MLCLRCRAWLLLALIAFAPWIESARAELVKLDVTRREPFAGGVAFGDTGPYEIIAGIARFAVDPGQARNQAIVDLDKAPRNADGKVEFESDIFILAPKDPAKGNGAILYDVNNRGNKTALGMFNSATRSNDPTTSEHAGNGFLFRRGYTVVWAGWIGELLSGENRLLLKAPVATDKGQPIRGLVRHEMVADAPHDTMPLAQRQAHGSYLPTAEGEKKATLTWRMRETDERVPIPREQWTLERQPIAAAKGRVGGTLPQILLRVAGGFRPGYIYEAIIESEGPIVQGLGYATTRDLIAFLKYDASEQNPLRRADGKPSISRAHGFGVSQSGRFLRNFLYLGFNADEKDRIVFDGLIPHVAGGGLGFFNHRFAQPTRHNGQHENHSYPCDVFPFTYGDAVDPFSKRNDGILTRLQNDNPKFLPKVMHTQSAAEYWHRAGSLVHTDPLGTKDAAIPANVRVYAFGGTQHAPAADPPGRGDGENLTNPGDYRVLLRALLDGLDQWVKDGTAPPPSVYPRIDQKTLVDWRQTATGFPAIPGVRYPEVIQRPQALELGPDFWTKGIIAIEPPKKIGDYVVLAAKCGPDGNDLGCLLVPEVGVPLATYTGWNLRRRDVGAEAMLANLMGSYIPFTKTKAERQQSGDPRLSLEERYGSFDKYQQQFATNCGDLVKQRYLLKEDADRLIGNRDKFKPLFGGGK